MRFVKFNDSDIKELSAIIKGKDHVDVEPHVEMSGIWLRSADDMTELRLLKAALTNEINSREVYMKGIDHSYYYEGYTAFQTEEL